MTRKITNTQYLRKGMLTNVGVVSDIYDNKNFKTTDGWSHNVDQEEVVITVKERRPTYDLVRR